MRRSLFVAVSVALALAILLSMTGCCCSLGSSESSRSESQRVEVPYDDDRQDETPGLEFPEESVSIIGTWETTIDYGAVVEEAFLSDEEYAEFLALGSDFFDRLGIKSTITFYADGTMVAEVDEASEREFIEEFIVAVSEVSIESLGLNMSVEEYLESDGKSLEEVIDEVYAYGSYTEALNPLKLEGMYQVDGNTLYFIQDHGTLESIYRIPFTLTVNTLAMEAIIYENVGTAAIEEIGLDAACPITYTRVR